MITRSQSKKMNKQMITRSQTKKMKEDIYGPYGVFILDYYGGEIKRDNKGKLRITWEKGYSDKWEYDPFQTIFMTRILEDRLNHIDINI